jgi:hypothetical protein
MRILTLPALLLASLTFGGSALAETDSSSVITKLNSHNSVQGTESSKGWRTLFDAYLNMSAPPSPVGTEFNLNTIWNGMDDWSSVSGWAAANGAMADAIIAASERTIVGLPYGLDAVPATYRSKGIAIEIWADGNLQNNRFLYLDALAEILAFSTAETVRRYETGDHDGAVALSMAQLKLLRKFCDRDFLTEKLQCMQWMIDSLSNVRDNLYQFGASVSTDQLRYMARKELAYLRTDRSRLFIPEADRIVAEEIFTHVFDTQTGRAIPEKFREVFTEIQVDQEPLSRFGAGRRWEDLAVDHGGLPASQERLTDIFDDWWRRWRISEYSQIYGMDSEFELTNPTRYAAVLFVVNDIKDVFRLRKELLSQVRGTIASAALCYYRNARGQFPPQLVALYPDPLSQRYSKDVFDEQMRPLQYVLVKGRTAIDIDTERRWVPADDCILYSLGANMDNDSKDIGHPVHGDDMDLLFWPPVKSLLRNVTPNP